MPKRVESKKDAYKISQDVDDEVPLEPITTGKGKKKAKGRKVKDEQEEEDQADVGNEETSTDGDEKKKPAEGAEKIDPLTAAVVGPGDITSTPKLGEIISDTGAMALPKRSENEETNDSSSGTGEQSKNTEDRRSDDNSGEDSSVKAEKPKVKFSYFSFLKAADYVFNVPVDLSTIPTPTDRPFDAPTVLLSYVPKIVPFGREPVGFTDSEGKQGKNLKKNIVDRMLTGKIYHSGLRIGAGKERKAMLADFVNDAIPSLSSAKGLIASNIVDVSQDGIPLKDSGRQMIAAPIRGLEIGGRVLGMNSLHRTEVADVAIFGVSNANGFRDYYTNMDVRNNGTHFVPAVRNAASIRNQPELLNYEVGRENYRSIGIDFHTFNVFLQMFVRARVTHYQTNSGYFNKTLYRDAIHVPFLQDAMGVPVPFDSSLTELISHPNFGDVYAKAISPPVKPSTTVNILANSRRAEKTATEFRASATPELAVQAWVDLYEFFQNGAFQQLVIPMDNFGLDQGSLASYAAAILCVIPGVCISNLAGIVKTALEPFGISGEDLHDIVVSNGVWPSSLNRHSTARQNAIRHIVNQLNPRTWTELEQRSPWGTRKVFVTQYSIDVAGQANREQFSPLYTKIIRKDFLTEAVEAKLTDVNKMDSLLGTSRKLTEVSQGLATNVGMAGFAMLHHNSSVDSLSPQLGYSPRLPLRVDPKVINLTNIAALMLHGINTDVLRSAARLSRLSPAVDRMMGFTLPLELAIAVHVYEKFRDLYIPKPVHFEQAVRMYCSIYFEKPETILSNCELMYSFSTSEPSVYARWRDFVLAHSSIFTANTANGYHNVSETYSKGLQQNVLDTPPHEIVVFTSRRAPLQRKALSVSERQHRGITSGPGASVFSSLMNVMFYHNVTNPGMDNVRDVSEASTLSSYSSDGKAMLKPSYVSHLDGALRIKGNMEVAAFDGGKFRVGGAGLDSYLSLGPGAFEISTGDVDQSIIAKSYTGNHIIRIGNIAEFQHRALFNTDVGIFSPRFSRVAFPNAIRLGQVGREIVPSDPAAAVIPKDTVNTLMIGSTQMSFNVGTDANGDSSPLDLIGYMRFSFADVPDELTEWRTTDVFYEDAARTRTEL